MDWCRQGNRNFSPSRTAKKFHPSMGVGPSVKAEYCVRLRRRPQFPCSSPRTTHWNPSEDSTENQSIGHYGKVFPNRFGKSLKRRGNWGGDLRVPVASCNSAQVGSNVGQRNEMSSRDGFDNSSQLGNGSSGRKQETAHVESRDTVQDRGRRNDLDSRAHGRECY